MRPDDMELETVDAREGSSRLHEEFLANMSHELRTPLNTIIGMTEALIEDVYAEVNDKQRRSLGMVRQAGLNLLSLINDILDLAKIEAGKHVPEKDLVALSTTCEASLRFIHDSARKKKLTVTTELPA